ncbi:MAG: hypothetical protein AB8H80_12455 [Planctomycetota bacterium]
MRISHWDLSIFTPPNAYQQTAEGLRLKNSTVTLTHSSVEGQNAIHLQGPQWRERSAAYIESGVLRVAPDTFIMGGASLSGGRIGIDGTSPAVARLEVADLTTLIPQQTGSSQVCCQPIPTDIWSIGSTAMVAGEQGVLYTVGPPGGFALMLIGDYMQAVPTPFGSLHLVPGTESPLDLVALGAQFGDFTWNPQVPLSMPVLHAFAFQGVYLSPSLKVTLGEPMPFAVGWPHGVQP